MVKTGVAGGGGEYTSVMPSRVKLRGHGGENN
jgi:hypothetical protein